MNAQEKTLTDKFRLQASQLFEESCPEESRFLLQEHVNTAKTDTPEYAERLDKSFCKHCYQWLRPDNYRVRLRPKCRPSARVQRLKQRIAHGRVLGAAQKSRLRRFMMSSSVLMATCHTCNKTTRHRGMNREYLSTLSTPGSSSKQRTPLPANRTWSASTPGKTPSKNKTPQLTPRSTSSTPGSVSSTTPSNKTPSKPKHWVVKRLTSLLMREDKSDSNRGTKGTRGSLKDFLTSL
ncbi:UPF0711 protein C18orf21 homolog [Stigmatopora argus]